ncbi:MAG: SDR family NAD(P)-dependent oxidoreductase [Chloroflexi bacterium]|nr:SDR family NAD(P)-dependent oxidoreductase [Chloroflexota bacterium]
MRLADKVALVTGSSRGLGKAMALTFAREGATVVVTGRTEEPHPRIGGTIGQTVEEIRAAGGTALAVRCDVGSEEDLQRLLDAALAEYGRVDILVHNAAALIPGGILDLTARRWDLLWNVNVRALFFLAKGVIPSMQARGGGHILNVSPALRLPDPAEQLAPGQTPRGVNLGALPKQWASQLALTMAQELLPHRIAVNCLFPGGARNTEGMRATRGGQPYGHTSPQLFADAALAIVAKDPASYTGRTVTDEEALREEGVTDFRPYLESQEATEPDRNPGRA